MKIQVGDIIQAINRPGLTHKVLGFSADGHAVRLKKLSCDGAKTNPRPIGDEFEVSMVEFNQGLFKLKNPFEPIPNRCGCDCGGWSTYQSEASHCHSSWCFVNTKKI